MEISSGLEVTPSQTRIVFRTESKVSCPELEEVHAGGVLTTGTRRSKRLEESIGLVFDHKPGIGNRTHCNVGEL